MSVVIGWSGRARARSGRRGLAPDQPGGPEDGGFDEDVASLVQEEHHPAGDVSDTVAALDEFVRVGDAVGEGHRHGDEVARAPGHVVMVRADGDGRTSPPCRRRSRTRRSRRRSGVPVRARRISVPRAVNSFNGSFCMTSLTSPVPPDPRARPATCPTPRARRSWPASRGCRPPTCRDRHRSGGSRPRSRTRPRPDRPGPARARGQGRTRAGRAGPRRGGTTPHPSSWSSRRRSAVISGDHPAPSTPCTAAGTAAPDTARSALQASRAGGEARGVFFLVGTLS